ncbi:MAG: rod shape-determining protein MreC [Rickettsiaceae bacterium]|nr:rod shape-determining protein MreC [Rickettsiaceae bacterium]
MNLSKLLKIFKYLSVFCIAALLILLWEVFFKQNNSFLYTPTAISDKFLDLLNPESVEHQTSKEDDVLEKFKILQQELKNSEHKLMILKGENEALKKHLNLPNLNENFTYLTVKILAVNKSIYNNFAIAKAPTQYKVTPGAWVINSEGIVGKIESVDGGYLRIMLVTDFHFKIGVMSSGSRHRAVLSGRNSDILELSYAQDPNTFLKDELLVTSGDGTYPISDIAVAKIILSKDNNVVATSVVDFNKLDFVSIIVELPDLNFPATK